MGSREATRTAPRVHTQVGSPATGQGQGGKGIPPGHLGPRKAKPVGFRFSFLAVPSDPQLQATGHWVPCCPAQHSTTASVDRGSGKKRPGLRVRRPSCGDKHPQCQRRQSPALKGLESTSRHMYLSVFPSPIPLLDYHNHFEKIITFSPAPPIFSPWAAAQDRWRLGQVWWWEAQCLTPFVVHPTSLSQLLGVD